MFGAPPDLQAMRPKRAKVVPKRCGFPATDAKTNGDRASETLVVSQILRLRNESREKTYKSDHGDDGRGEYGGTGARGPLYWPDFGRLHAVDFVPGGRDGIQAARQEAAGERALRAGL